MSLYWSVIFRLFIYFCKQKKTCCKLYILSVMHTRISMCIFWQFSKYSQFFSLVHHRILHILCCRWQSGDEQKLGSMIYQKRNLLFNFCMLPVNLQISHVCVLYFFLRLVKWDCYTLVVTRLNPTNQSQLLFRSWNSTGSV